MVTTVTDRPELSRFEIHEDGRLAGFADYVVHGTAVTIPHTEITPELGGRGLGSELVRGALQMIAGRGQSVLPQCPFVAHYIARHPDLLDVVPASARSRFGLPATTTSERAS